MKRVGLQRTALITGAARGIGRAICDALASQGIRILALDQDHGALSTSVNELRLAGATVDPLFTDLADASDLASVLAEIVKAGTEVDVLVPCAAIDPREDQLRVPLESAHRQFAVNMLATLQMVEAFVPGMQQRGWGRVVAIGSVQEERPRPDNLIYAALKAAQTHAMRNWARSAAGPNLTFNVVRPGAIETDRNRDVLADPAYRQAVLDRIPLGRLGRAADCSAVVAWLCGEQAAYVNGAVIDVDGGMRL